MVSVVSVLHLNAFVHCVNSVDKDKALQLQQFSNTDQPMQSAMAVPVNTFADGPSR